MTCRRLLNAFVVALLTAALSGCMSMVGLGYDHAETVAAWKAEQYFDLDIDQEQAFRARFAQLYAWHRYEQLPEYVAFLTAGRQRIERGLKADDVRWFADGLKVRYRVLVRRGAPDAAALLSTLNSAQVEHLRRRWDKDNRKFAEDHKLDDRQEDRRRSRAKRLISQIENWTGDLTSEQAARVRSLSDSLPDTDRLRQLDRMRRQNEFLALLEQRGADRKEFAARLARWLSDWESGRDPEYGRLADASWEQRIQVYVAVERMLTPEQRAKLLQRLQDHIAEFQRLARRS